MWAHSLTVQDYQDLIDRGWRRSGKYCYKPTMHVTCCPHYTIKCEAGKFKMSKSHKKIIKTVNRYLIHGIKRGDGKEYQEESAAKGDNPVEPAPKEEISGKDETMKDSRKTPKPGLGADSNLPKAKKAKDIRKELKKKKQEATSSGDGEQAPVNDPDTPVSKPSTNEAKTLEDFLSEPDKAEKCAHKLEIKLVRSSPRSSEFNSSLKESYKIYRKYQMGIHLEEESDCNHDTYTGFLVDSPLEEEHTSKDLPLGYGSFHQQYILDGKVIAVGVIDILPYCTSSVYLYYDPDYNFLSLGTYSALREIAFTRSLTKMAPALQYYYMGYYIHSCPKMVYKGQYYPSFLLCPETYTWHPIEECKPKLDVSKYSRFADSDVEDENGKIDLDKVTILFMRQMMTYDIYKALNPKAKDAKEVLEYSKFVGKKCAERMLLCRK